MTADMNKLLRLIDSLGDKIDANIRTRVLRNIGDNNAWVDSDNYNNIVSTVSTYLQMQEDIESQWRLPKSSVPRHYDLHIDARNIHTGATDFTGEVWIDIAIEETTNYIMIHSKNQVIDMLHVFTKDERTVVPLLDYRLNAEFFTLTIYLLENVQVGDEFTIHIKYSTNLLPSTSGTGFYQAFYDINGERKYLGATQFESTGGRNAFPHYDEPGLKATFDLKITHDASLHAIANTIGHEDTK